YMYVLDRGHPWVEETTRLVARLRAGNVQPIVYVTPVDYQTCGAYLGPRFEKRIAANVEVMRGALAAVGVELLDLSRLLGAEEFNWRVDSYPNEHMLESGRRKVAEEVARRVRE